MPLLIICGKPCTSKTKRAEEIKKFFNEDHKDIEVEILNEERFDIDKNLMYSTFTKEKELRGFFRSNVDKFLTNKNLVIMDSLNYIKGKIFFFQLEIFVILK